MQVMPVCTQAWGSDFEKLAEQLWTMMSEMESRDYFRSHAPRSWRPHLNLYETPDKYAVCVELAGMPREAIDVRASDGVLHISGARAKPTPPDNPENVGVRLMEIDSGRFHRKIPIPSDVMVDEIKATYSQGYLWVILPRSADASRSEGT
jgi:HSP20 family protein